MMWFAIAGGALIIVGLGFYAGSLLSKLKAQKERQSLARNKRLDNINESIQTIAFAMTQQQCNLSEGAIRICRILESVPLLPLPDYASQYPAIHKLFEQVKDLPTHEARAALSKKDIRRQDKDREQQESELESEILKEVKILKTFKAQ